MPHIEHQMEVPHQPFPEILLSREGGFHFISFPFFWLDEAKHSQKNELNHCLTKNPNERRQGRNIKF